MGSLARGIKRRLAGVPIALSVASCALGVSFEDYRTQTFGVRGTVAGLGTGRATLLLRWHRQLPSQDNELQLEVSDGPFAFAPRLVDSAQYEIAVIAEPPFLACLVDKGAGTIVRANAEGVFVMCMPSYATKPDAGTVGVSGDAAADCVATINTYRLAHGRKPLFRWTDVDACANGQAATDGVAGVYRTQLGKCGESAQNECGRYQGPPSAMIRNCLSSMYAEGPGGLHFDLMMSATFQEVSCGFGVAPDGRIWAVQDFR